ncbi:MAG TPA: acyltransferase [Candidatus Acidoferrales bacterium]|jgi:peptidoglycan/LPS O-acetylase OafA/YrhL|nr:acyltransferase [Candidatus Acidoferrales bacterium]
MRAFYIRRILRIWPLYFAMLGFGYIFGLLRPEVAWGSHRLFAYLFLVGNIYTARHVLVANPAIILWSISVEEQFYLLWPSIVRRGTQWLKILSSLLIPLAYLWLGVLLRAGTSLNPGVWTNSVVQFQFFGIGSLLAVHLHGRNPTFRGLTRAALIGTGIGSCVLASTVFEVFGIGPVPMWKVMSGYGLVAVGCALLCVGVLGAPSAWFPRWLVFLGKISYGLYVFHFLALRITNSAAIRLHRFAFISTIVKELQLPIALGITILIACASYRYFETPFLRIKERFEFVKSREV